ncbi:hypothetical protein DFS34DRAFT_639317 [Phlyctochytrium arcticum]|nr:hypothetical protein DFS34DRAFT_639317 [Phlyctochytrium arcticum]
MLSHRILRFQRRSCRPCCVILCLFRLVPTAAEPLSHDLLHQQLVSYEYTLKIISCTDPKLPDAEVYRPVCSIHNQTRLVSVFLCLRLQRT